LACLDSQASILPDPFYSSNDVPVDQFSEEEEEEEEDAAADQGQVGSSQEEEEALEDEDEEEEETNAAEMEGRDEDEGDMMDNDEGGSG
jgi:hypothetical protein